MKCEHYLKNYVYLSQRKTNMGQFIINFPAEEDPIIDDLKTFIDNAITNAAERIIAELQPRKLVKGVAAGIAKPLGVSVPTAYKLYNSGIFDDAISRHDRNGRQVILVDINKVREIALRTNITKNIK